MKSAVKTKYATLPFCAGLAHQKYLKAEEGILAAFEAGCTHWYVDGSLIGEMTEDWSRERIDNLKRMIDELNVRPIFHGNFKAPLASDVEDFRVAAVTYVKKEIDIAQAIGAPIIIHGGCIVEPKMIVQAKKIGLDNYLKSIVELSTYAEPKGVDIYLENLSNYKNYRPFHYMYTHIEEYDYILNRLVGRNGIYLFLDVGHEHICDGDPSTVIRKYHHLIKGISFSNNNGQQDQHFGIKDGTLNYDLMMQAIIDSNWKGLVAFETRNQSTLKSLEELTEIYRAVTEEEATA
jgi:L-ribulose-5-phosphate 3-epimerase